MVPRLENGEISERITLRYDHAELTGDLTVVLYEVPDGRSLRIDRCRYYNATGLAEDTTNVIAISLLNALVVVAGPITTDSDSSDDDVSIVAATWTDIPVVSGANVLAAGETLSAFFDEGGAVTLPPGVLLVEGTLF